MAVFFVYRKSTGPQKCKEKHFHRTFPDILYFSPVDNTNVKATFENILHKWQSLAWTFKVSHYKSD